MFCTNCGKECEDNAVFCTSCGNILQQAAQPQAVITQPKAEVAQPKTEKAKGKNLWWILAYSIMTFISVMNNLVFLQFFGPNDYQVRFFVTAALQLAPLSLAIVGFILNLKNHDSFTACCI